MTPRGAPSIEGNQARPSWRRELLAWLALFAVYLILTGIDWPGRHDAAVRHSRWLFDLERASHLDVELGLNRWLAHRQVLRTAANYEYAITYLATTFGLLAWLAARRPATYRWARTSFVLMNVVSLVVFLAFPVAPPRFLPDIGFVDTVVQGRTWGSWGSPMVSHANQLGAMPSLHIGWALWVSLILAAIASGWPSQVFSAVHIVVTLVVIMGTANHYLVDAVGGAALALGCVAVTRPGSGMNQVTVGSAPREPGRDLGLQEPLLPGKPQPREHQHHAGNGDGGAHDQTNDHQPAPPRRSGPRRPDRTA